MSRALFGANSVLVDGPGGSAIDALRDDRPGDVLLAISVKPYTPANRRRPRNTPTIAARGSSP